MFKTKLQNWVIAFVLGVATLVMAASANADPPARVARLGYLTGTVSFSPAGEDEWVQATMNRPLVTGDRIWVDAGGRTEMQLGAAAIRMGSSTSVTLLNVDDRVVQLQVAQGSLSIRVRTLGANDVFEIDTPNVAFSIRRPGEYRIDVDAAGSATIVAVRSGQGDVYGEGASYVINARQAYRFAGTGLRDYERFDTLPLDEFDRWASERDRRWEKSTSARYVSPEVIGYQDLDTYGTWRVAPGYGNMWVPSRVSADWAPYRDGHWAWVDPWGWTWVDDAPWGFAVSHYGRWANLGGTWGWVPGPVATRAVYAPALVAFVGGNNFSLSVSGGNGIGWFPLGPREVYRPAYAVSRRYFDDVNLSNTMINRNVIGNYYSNPNAPITYANRQVPNAVVAVPRNAFLQAEPVSRAAVRVQREALANAQITGVAPVAPMRASFIGAAKPGGKPPPAALERPVVARTAPPPRVAGFAPREQLLAKNPGRPLDNAELRNLGPSPAHAGKIQIVTPNASAPTSAPPARQAKADKPGKGDRLQPPAQVAQPASQPVAPQAPVGGAPGRMASKPAAPAPVPHVAVPREPRGKPEHRAPPPTAAAQPPAAAPAAPPVQHQQREARAKPDKHNSPAAAAIQPPVASPAAPVATPPVQRQQREARAKPDKHNAPPAQVAAPPPVAAPAPAPMAAPADRHPRPDRAAKPEHRQPAPPPVAAQPAVAPPPPVANAQPQGGGKHANKPPHEEHQQGGGEEGGGKKPKK